MTLDSASGGVAAGSQASAGPASASQAASGVSAGPAGGKALRMAPWQGIAAAVLGGLIVWGVLGAILPMFEIDKELQELQGPAIAPRLAEIQEQTKWARIKNAVLAITVTGAVLGLALAVAELLVRRAATRAVWGGVVAVVVAAIVAFGAGSAGAAVSELIGPTGNPLVPAKVSPLVKYVLVQGVTLSLMGLGIGLAMSLPLTRPRPILDCVIGCLLGGLLAALIFPPLVGLLFSDVSTEDLLPEGHGRLLWLVFVAALMGLTVTGLGKAKKSAVAG